MNLKNDKKDITRASILDHFQHLDDLLGQITNDVALLEEIGHDPKSDIANLRHAVDASTFFLRTHLSDLTDISDSCYSAVRRSWGYDD